MESRAGVGAGDDEVVKEAVGGTTSCFGPDPQCPGWNHLGCHR